MLQPCPELQISHEPATINDQQVTVVHLVGRLNNHIFEACLATLRELLDAGPVHLRIDLGQVRIHNCGDVAIIAAYGRARELQGSITLCNVSESNRRALPGLAQVLTMERLTIERLPPAENSA